MDKPRPCGCKGRRTCLICESEYNIHTEEGIDCNAVSYVYCPLCNKAFLGWNLEEYKSHPLHNKEYIDFPGIYINLNFLNEYEETSLLEGIDKMRWDLSQSGRRKQNFGPKCNFKKRKLRLGEFNGFPIFSKFVQDKFTSEPILKGFQTIEQCSLEYDPERGASIDPHIDDCWIWGERIVTVNLLSDSVLTMTYNAKSEKYNLDCVSQYPAVVLDKDNCKENNCYDVKKKENGKDYPIVRIPMPRRSLLVMYGSARYDWEHRILREDIVNRRVCLAYREFTPPYLENGSFFNEGLKILEKAKNFF